MKVYVAGSFAEIDHCRRIAEILTNAGHVVTSRWLEGGGQAPDHPDAWPPVAAHWAEQCRQDVDAASVVVVVNPSASLTGGTMWEFGYAIGRQKLAVVLGLPSNVFCYQVPCMTGVYDVLRWMAGKEAMG